MKYCYRVTKYDPRFRDTDDRYTRDDWTFYAQIGKRVGGHVLTVAEYLRTEALYLSALRLLLVEAGISRLEVRGLWLPPQPTPQLRAWLRRHVLGVQQALSFAQLVLRNRIGGQLIAPRRAYVHFGFDYYLYVGLSRPTPNAVSLIHASGLFVESAPSPYATMRPNPGVQWTRFARH